jgi:mannose-6-phosphate isomerase-like protein (cupin superfamily)
MAGFVVRQHEAPLRANAARTEQYRTSLGIPAAPTDALRGGWYALAAGSANPPDVHAVDEIYFIVGGTAEIELDGVRHRLNGGDTVLVPSGCHHQLVNDGDDELTLVFLFSPPPPARPPGTQSNYAIVEE